jgi:ankyrin repeat protein
MFIRLADLLQAEGFLGRGVTPGVKDKEGRTGAHFAAAHGELEMLQFLYSKGVDVDAEDSIGRSPLHYAALRDHESVIVFLASKGAWVDSCDATDCSPLHLAARCGAAAAAARLLKMGAKSHIQNQWNLTALGVHPNLRSLFGNRTLSVSHAYASRFLHNNNGRTIASLHGHLAV